MQSKDTFISENESAVMAMADGVQPELFVLLDPLPETDKKRVPVAREYWRHAQVCVYCYQKIPANEKQAARNAHKQCWRVADRHGQIMRRCYNEGSPWYPWYGGRGIEVEKYLQNRKHFFDLISSLPKPAGKWDIDRIDNEGNYCRGNIRLVPHVHNCRHKRDTVLTPSKAQTIRDLWAQGTPRKIIADYAGVHKSVVDSVLFDGHWKPDSYDYLLEGKKCS